MLLEAFCEELHPTLYLQFPMAATPNPERILKWWMVVLLTLGTDCSLVTSKPAHLSPYLPGREKGDKAFSADAVGSILDQEERVLDFWSIAAQMWAPIRLLHLFGMIEKPPGVFRHIAGDCYKGLKQRPFLWQSITFASSIIKRAKYFPLLVLLEKRGRRLNKPPSVLKNSIAEIYEEEKHRKSLSYEAYSQKCGSKT